MSIFVEKYKKMLENRNIDYKIKFAKKLINKNILTEPEGEQLLHYIFYENILKTDREVENAEIKSIYDSFYNKVFEGKVEKEVEFWIKHGQEIEKYINDMEMLEEMEEKHNKILSKR